MNLYSSSLIFMLSTLVSIACNRPEIGQGEFSLSPEPYAGDKLRLDGYYYEFDTMNNTIGPAYCFYRNGVIRSLGSWPIENDFEGFEENVRAVDSADILVSNGLRWGVFQIQDDSIAFEKKYPSSGGYHPVYIRAGRILNDTTFIITESYRSDGTERRPKDETYHFRPFSPKPDSTNDFVP